jgi:hypothetical protein
MNKDETEALNDDQKKPKDASVLSKKDNNVKNDENENQHNQASKKDVLVSVQGMFNKKISN